MATTRERIVAATTDLFRQRGFNGTSLKMITDGAGATTGSLYHFFPQGKDQLAAAVIEESGAAYLSLFETIANGHHHLVDGLTGFFEGAALVLEETEFVDPCPIGTIAREVASVNEPLRQTTAGVFRSWIGALAGRLQTTGFERADADELATTIVAIIEGGFVLSRTAHDAAPLRACGRQVVRLLASQTSFRVENDRNPPKTEHDSFQQLKQLAARHVSAEEAGGISARPRQAVDDA
jgi:AcrR family transcriptional regulator